MDSELVVQSVLAYLLGRKAPRLPAASRLPEMDEHGLWETGTELVARVTEAIRVHRSVLLTGPRGSGKSYCAEKGIKAAREGRLIRGHRFLQGNREIPRDTLSEDMLVLDEQGRPQLLEALALRPIDVGDPRVRERRGTHPAWPAVRALDVPDGEGYLGAQKLWEDEEKISGEPIWVVLYLDEITRFADGFLDSLLSLTEERKIVRRGEDYYVPMVVVATANPPGYDATAKKLSPPLQARISRSYRVSQPSLEVLADVIVASQWREITRHYRNKGFPFRDDEVIGKLAAAATLCLWGDPGAKGKGAYYLTRGTRELLQQLMARDRRLADAMRRLSGLIVFGPDSRAVLDWLACAVGRAFSKWQERRVTRRDTEPPCSGQDLIETAVEVLGHKVRENFNEGAEPDLLLLRDQCIRTIVERVITNDRLHSLLVTDFAGVALALVGPGEKDEDRARAEGVLRATLGGLPPVRRAVWQDALRAVRRDDNAETLERRWEQEALQCGALAARREFFVETERDAAARLFRELRPDIASYGQGMAGWAVSTEGHFEAEMPLMSEALRQFAPDLRQLLRTHRTVLPDRHSQHAWLLMLDRVLTRDELTAEVLRGVGWDLLRSHYSNRQALNPASPEDLLCLARESFEVLCTAANRAGLARARLGLQRVKAVAAIPFSATAVAVAADPAKAVARRCTLVRSALDFIKDRDRRGEDGTERVRVWMVYLQGVARGHERRDDPTWRRGLARSRGRLPALGKAESCPEAPGRFRDGAEMAWVCSLLVQLTPPLVVGSHLVGAREELSRVPCSPARFLPLGNEPQRVRQAFLDALRPPRETAKERKMAESQIEKPLFDSFAEPRPETVERLRDLYELFSEAGDMRFGVHEIAARCLSALAVWASPPGFDEKFPKAMQFLGDILGRVAKASPGVAGMAEDAARAIQGITCATVRAAAHNLTGGAGREAVLLDALADLARLLSKAGPSHLACVADWSLAFADLNARKDTRSVLAKVGVVSRSGFTSFEERAWVAGLAQRLGAQPVLVCARDVPLDPQGTVERFTPGVNDRLQRAFLVRLVDSAGDLLAPCGSEKLGLFGACHAHYWAASLEADRTRVVTDAVEAFASFVDAPSEAEKRRLEQGLLEALLATPPAEAAAGGVP